MISKKFLTILVSGMIITGSLALSSITVNATGFTGWKQIKSTIYLFKNGVRISGWTKNGNSYYYFNANKGMLNGWINVGGYQYFLSHGIRQTSWVNLSGKWYFFRTDGTLAPEITINNVTIGKKYCAYSSIQDAINKVPNGSKLVIYPGTYNEHVTLIQRNISLQGTNKDTCIIQDDSGNYYNAPLTSSGNGNISNLSFVSTHNKSNYKIPSYALHCDANGAGTMKFTNCSFTSYQNSAVGIGMRQSQTIIFDNCDMKSVNGRDAGLYCHNAQFQNVTNQHLIVENCNITTNSATALSTEDANIGYHNTNSQMDMAFYNNTFSVGIKSNSMVIFRDKPLNDGICGQIKLTKDSSGNNIACLNVLK